MSGQLAFEQADVGGNICRIEKTGKEKTGKETRKRVVVAENQPVPVMSPAELSVGTQAIAHLVGDGLSAHRKLRSKCGLRG